MRMIPPQISATTKSSAEKRLFEEFQRLPRPDTYSCLHSVNLPEHIYKTSGEIDFVVLGPRGLYVLEVKGGNVSCRNGIWAFTNRWGESTRKSEGPFQQASSAMYSLRERLLRHLSDQELSQLVTGYGVLFPDIEFDVQGVEVPREVIFDAQRWREQGLSAYLKALETYWHAKRPAAPATASPELIKRVSAILRPDFDLVPTLRIEADRIEDQMVRLTEEQYDRLDWIEHSPRLLVEGGAGTGKTFLAVEIARRHAARQQRVLLVCFSPVLTDFLKLQTRGTPVTVTSVHNLMLDMVRQYGDLPPGYHVKLPLTDPWFKQHLIPAFLGAAKQVPPEQQYDVLIIDEAQDILNLDYLAALGSILRGGLEQGMWRIFYDEFNQGAIFGASDPAVLELLREYQSVAPELRINCRNTHEIVFQTKILTGADLGTKSTGPGPTVLFKYYADDNEAAGILNKQLDDLHSRGVEDRYITILSPCPYAQSSARLISEKWRRRLTVLEDLSQWHFPLTRLTFATVADFKGLENRFILLTDIDDLDSTPSALATVYVGMSRARVGLLVVLQESAKQRQIEITRRHLPAVLEEMKHD